MMAWGRLSYLGGALAVSTAAGFVGADWLKDNKDALASILSFFSVLTGFLVAVIALAADDRNLRGANWRAKHYNAKTIRRRLMRHRMLFSIYLTACFLAFVDSLKMKLSDDHQAWLNGATLGVTIFAFLLSFSLPHNLSAEYIRRLDVAIKEAKRPSAPVAPPTSSTSTVDQARHD
jgi:predicted alpha/beta-fold hydrolase